MNPTPTTVPPDFPWRPGMLDGSSGDHMFSDTHILRVDGIDSGVEERPGDAWPDYTDDATVGALLGAVRVAFGEPRIHCKPYEDGWAVIGVPTPGAPGLAGMLAPILGDGPTEFSALLAAWDARPKT